MAEVVEVALRLVLVGGGGIYSGIAHVALRNDKLITATMAST